MATEISKTAFTIETTLSIAKCYLGLYRSIESSLQSIFENLTGNDSSWTTSIDNSNITYYSIVLKAFIETETLVSLLQLYLSNQTTSENEYTYRIPVTRQLDVTNNSISNLLEFWKKIMPLSNTENNSTNVGKFQNFSIESQKIHYQNILFLAQSVQSSLTTITVLFSTVDKSEETVLSNLHVDLFENFIDNAHEWYRRMIQSLDELESLIDHQIINGKLITRQTAASYIAVSELMCSSFENFQISTKDILNELSK